MPRPRTTGSPAKKAIKKKTVFPRHGPGHVPGVPVGSRWDDRGSMATSGIHSHGIWGIYGHKATGAVSVVLAGYFADEDHGDHFTYIGSGGRASGVRVGPQTCDQSFDNSFNEALRMSAVRKIQVRVTRGGKLTSKWAPHAGFRYDGLYTVSNPRIEDGPNGFKVCKFDFKRCANQAPLPAPEAHPDSGHRSDIDVRHAEWKATRAQSDEEDLLETAL